MTTEAVEEFSEALAGLVVAVQRAAAAAAGVVADPESRAQAAQALATVVDSVAASFGGGVSE